METADEILVSYTQQLEEQNEQLKNKNKKLESNLKSANAKIKTTNFVENVGAGLLVLLAIIGLVWLPSICIWNAINYKDTGRFYTEIELVYHNNTGHYNDGICIYHEFDWALDDVVECNVDKDFNWADQKIKEHRDRWLKLQKINGNKQ